MCAHECVYRRLYMGVIVHTCVHVSMHVSAGEVRVVTVKTSPIPSHAEMTPPPVSSAQLLAVTAFSRWSFPTGNSF